MLDALRPMIRERLRTWAHLPRLLRSIWAVNPALVLGVIALRLLRAAQPPLVLFVGKLIIDEIVLQTRAPAPTAGDWLASGRLSTLGGWIFLEFLLMAGVSALTRIGALAESVLAEKHGNALAVQLILQAARIDLRDIENSDAQDKLSRARVQTMIGGGLLTQALSQAQDAITILLLLAGLVAYAPLLIVLLVVALIPTLFGEAHFNARSYELATALTPERRQMEYLRHIGAATEPAKEVKLFGLGGFIADRFAAVAAKVQRENRILATRRAIWRVAFSATASLAYYIAYAIIAWRAVGGQISIGDVTFLAGSLLRLSSLSEGLIMGLTQLSSQAQYLDDFFAFMSIKPAIAPPAAPQRFPSPMQEGVRFENVGFRYPGKEEWALRGLNFTLAAGETLALVGENGAGKTTIVKLLTRLYDPDEGRILVDGIDLREIDLDDLREHVGAIFQDFMRYQISAGDNIGVGRSAAIDDRPRIVEAARKSLADMLVERMPMQYDQMLGRTFAHGSDLSGGEWQKFAIARAYFRNADLLILDEPTSALDARAEASVFERFRNLSHSKTALLISHRFSTVRMADRILVIENGAILESGDHAALMARKGRYAELFGLQAAGFQ